VPFVAIFGETFNIRHFACLLGGGIGAAAWSLATRLGLSGRDRILGWAFPIVGTTFWYEAKHGTTWGVAALASGLFLFLSLNEYFGKRRLPLIGLFLALAVASRPAAILAFVAFGVAILTAPGASRKVTALARKAVELAAAHEPGLRHGVRRKARAVAVARRRPRHPARDLSLRQRLHAVRHALSARRHALPVRADLHRVEGPSRVRIHRVARGLHRDQRVRRRLHECLRPQVAARTSTRRRQTST